MLKQYHPYHMVTISPWPLLSSMSALISAGGLVLTLNNHYCYIMMLGMMSLFLTMFMWWRDVVRESTFQGDHTQKVLEGLKMGMILFIISEIMFFVSFFWAFFHSSLSMSIELASWPPYSISSFNPMHMPLLNSVILLSSGISLTWAHHSLIINNMNLTMKALIITITQGMIFTSLQMLEYLIAPFTISDSIYGSTFFMSTGFHGLHVIIGSMFLFISFIRLYNLHYSTYHHFNFEASAWYWHFEDVVWLFLYTSIYWWGN